MPAIHRYAIHAGLISGLLFFLTWTEVLVGIFIPFTPLVPLFWAGFRLGGHAIGHAAFVALAVSLLLLGGDNTSFILLGYIMPTWIFGRQLLKARLTRHGGIEWYAVGNAIVALVTYMAVAFVLIGYYFAGGESDLPQMIQDKVRADTQMVDPEAGAAFTQFVTQFPFVIFGLLFWYATLMIYGAACLANYFCLAYGKALRRSLMILPYIPPSYVPVCLLLCGLAGFFVPHETAYVLQTVFLILLIPYFMLGLGLLHAGSKSWEGRRFWLGLFYVILAFFQWPAMFLITWGFMHHMRLLSGHGNQESK